MRKPVRREEPAVLAGALASLGLRELFSMPVDVFLEGGDVIPLARDGRRTLLVGFGPRTSRGRSTFFSSACTHGRSTRLSASSSSPSG
jgi:N-dimethylarginine dimethylaminohydrolase